MGLDTRFSGNTLRSQSASALRLVQLSGESIQFLRPGQPTARLAIRHTSMTSSSVVIKIKSSNPKAYLVSPSSLCLRPGDSEVFTFTLVEQSVSTTPNNNFDGQDYDTLNLPTLSLNQRQIYTQLKEQQQKKQLQQSKGISASNQDKFLLIAMEHDSQTLLKSTTTNLFNVVAGGAAAAATQDPMKPLMNQTTPFTKTSVSQTTNLSKSLNPLIAFGNSDKQQLISKYTDMFKSVNLKHQQRITVLVRITDSYQNVQEAQRENRLEVMRKEEGIVVGNQFEEVTPWTARLTPLPPTAIFVTRASQQEMQNIESKSLAYLGGGGSSYNSSQSHSRAKSGEPSPVLTNNMLTTSHSSAQFEPIHTPAATLRIPMVASNNNNNNMLNFRSAQTSNLPSGSTIQNTSRMLSNADSKDNENLNNNVEKANFHLNNSVKANSNINNNNNSGSMNLNRNPSQIKNNNILANSRNDIFNNGSIIQKGNTSESSLSLSGDAKRVREKQYKQDYEQLVQKVINYEKDFQILDQEIRLAVLEKQRLSMTSSYLSPPQSSRSASSFQQSAGASAGVTMSRQTTTTTIKGNQSFVASQNTNNDAINSNRNSTSGTSSMSLKQLIIILIFSLLFGIYLAK